jgi:hypothetical protein
MHRALRLLQLLMEEFSAAAFVWPLGTLEFNRRMRGFALEPQYNPQLNLDLLVGHSYQSLQEMELSD